MKRIIAAIVVVIALLTSATIANAAPWVPAGNQVTPNDKFVAYYPDGRHAIPGFSNDQYYGKDLVMSRGKSGQIHQWFEGTDPNGKFVAIHSVWNISKSGSCPKNWVTIKNAYPDWGHYLVPDATYCVHNNYYKGTK